MPTSKASHFQATIFASAATVKNAQAAVKYLDVRGFLTQVLKMDGLNAVDSSVIVKAAQNSNRLVTVEDQKGKMGSAVAAALTKAGYTIPVVRLRMKSPPLVSSAYIAEACLRNLE